MNKRAWLLCWPLWMAAQAMAQESGYTGEAFRVTGEWSGDRIEATRLQLRDKDDPAKGQISGRIEELDPAARRLRVGPVTVNWRDTTEFREMSAQQLAVGLHLRLSVRQEGSELTALSMQPMAPLPAGTLQIAGTVTAGAAGPGKAGDITVMGQRIALPVTGYNRLDSLTQRQDARRPDRPFGFDLFGRQVSITGEYDLSFRDRKNLRLDDRSRVRDLDHEFKLEMFYPFSDRASLFLSGNGVYEGEIYRAGGNTTSTRYLARDQTWLYFDRLGGSGFSLQAGRLNLAEAREWWWDDDLDGLRLLHDHGAWHSELMLARELLRERSDQPDIDAELDGITRLAGRVSWLWAPKQTLEVLFLHASDSSGTQGLGTRLPSWQEDGSDARLTWVGVRALGDRSLGNHGELRYWVDAAWVRGRETLIDYDDDGDFITVDDITHRKVRGAAYDLGVSWETRLPARPSFTLGQAWASGDGDGSDGIDHTFRQTGLHNNKWRYHGVNRFRYYGELLRPELSNLTVTTAGIGLSLGNARSLDLIHHRYRQDHATRSLRDARVSPSLTGRSRDVGEALDLVFGSREWTHMDLSLALSTFRAGQAYGSKAGERAWQALLEIAINF